MNKLMGSVRINERLLAIIAGVVYFCASGNYHGKYSREGKGKLAFTKLVRCVELF